VQLSTTKPSTAVIDTDKYTAPFDKKERTLILFLQSLYEVMNSALLVMKKIEKSGKKESAAEVVATRRPIQKALQMSFNRSVGTRNVLV